MRLLEHLFSTNPASYTPFHFPLHLSGKIKTKMKTWINKKYWKEEGGLGEEGKVGLRCEQFKVGLIRRWWKEGCQQCSLLHYSNIAVKLNFRLGLTALRVRKILDVEFYMFILIEGIEDNCTISTITWNPSKNPRNPNCASFMLYLVPIFCVYAARVLTKNAIKYDKYQQKASNNLRLWALMIKAKR